MSGLPLSLWQHLPTANSMINYKKPLLHWHLLLGTPGMSDHALPFQSLRMETLLLFVVLGMDCTLMDIEIPNPAEAPSTLHIPCPELGDCFLPSKVEGMLVLGFHASILFLRIESVLCAGGWALC